LIEFFFWKKLIFFLEKYIDSMHYEGQAGTLRMLKLFPGHYYYYYHSHSCYVTVIFTVYY